MITFTAVGDCFITRPFPERDSSLMQLTKILEQADVRMANLEITIHSGEVYPSAVSGGTWAVAAPKVLDTLLAYRFNLLAWANNHTLDYLHQGVIATKHHLDQCGFVHAGAGANLAEASAPKYLECESGRVAIIALATTAPPHWIAGDQRRDGIGRPGLNLLRTNTIYVITPEQKANLENLAQELHINADIKLAIEQGFRAPFSPDILNFGNYLFKKGDCVGVETVLNSNDLQRILKSIDQSKRSADYVLVSLHAHEMQGDAFEEPAKFLVDFAHRCIDQGAHAVVGHGPHIVRGIEIYKGKPIFYSLGNFIYQPETVSSQPADMFEKYGLSQNEDVVDALYTMSTEYSRGHSTIPEMWQAVVPVWRMADGELFDITLHPIQLGYGLPVYRMGWPRLTKDQTVLKRIARLSLPYGTQIEIKDAKGWVM